MIDNTTLSIPLVGCSIDGEFHRPKLGDGMKLTLPRACLPSHYWYPTRLHRRISSPKHSDLCRTPPPLVTRYTIDNVKRQFALHLDTSAAQFRCKMVQWLHAFTSRAGQSRLCQTRRKYHYNCHMSFMYYSRYFYRVYTFRQAELQF